MEKVTNYQLNISALLFTSLSLFSLTKCQNNNICGYLFSGENFGGSNQSVPFKTNENDSEDGSFFFTQSIRVHDMCVMKVCNTSFDPYLGEPYCYNLPDGELPLLHSNMREIASASCECQKTKRCTCEAIQIKKSSCGRAYLEGGCRSCNSIYIDLEKTSDMPQWNLPKRFPPEFGSRIEAIRLREGCQLSLYSGRSSESIEGNYIDKEVTENFQEKIEYYECSCDEKDLEPGGNSTKKEKASAPMVEVPSIQDELIKMLMDERYSTHPGLAAAYQSIKVGRSSKNAYVLVLGSVQSGKSSTINALFDQTIVTKMGCGRGDQGKDFICEYRIPMKIDDLGISNAQLRVIDTPGFGDTRGLDHDADLLNSLDNYLRSHEELKNRIPNVVLIFHKFNDRRFDATGSGFRTMLRGLDSFRTRITDENYSNVVFVLTRFCSENSEIQKRPEARILQFKTVIKETTLFPEPIFITLAENKAQDHKLPMVNGYARLPNGDYFPRNIFDKLELITIKGMDPIGQRIFHTAFRESGNFRTNSTNFKRVQNSDKVNDFLRILKTDFDQSNAHTDISKDLNLVWQHTNQSLKARFPNALNYLQATFKTRKISKKEDIPRNDPNRILDFIQTISNNEVTEHLLQVALGIRSPHFPSDLIIGHGYNIFEDKPLRTSPFAMDEYTQSDIGFQLPSIVSAELDPCDKMHAHSFKDEDDYAMHRLQNLGLKGNVYAKEFTYELQHGYNIGWNSTIDYFTVNREIKLYKLSVRSPKLSDKFRRKLQGLPSFDMNSQRSRDDWNQFFSEYGTHVIYSTHAGGAIHGTIDGKSLKHSILDLVKFMGGMPFLNIKAPQDNTTDEEVDETGSSAINPISLVKFVGGVAPKDLSLTTISDQNATEILHNWKKTLKYRPIELTSEMKLVPMSVVAETIDQRISREIERAMTLLYDSVVKPIGPFDDSIQKGLGLARDQIPEKELDYEGDVIQVIREILLGDSITAQEEFRNNTTNKGEDGQEEAEPGKEAKDSGCLRSTTRILMANGSEVKVEDLKVGDYVLDMHLNQAKVLGINYQFLRYMKFYGFDRQSYFFTGEHMFMGPSLENEVTSEGQLYVQSISRLLDTNPLMKYWNVKEMTAVEDLKLFHLNESSKLLEAKCSGVFEDPEVYPPETKVYFIQVDSPSGTYFANGYVCKVDMPPVERWPNTMSLLFRLVNTREVEALSRRKYSLETMTFLETIIGNLSTVVSDYISNIEIEPAVDSVQLMTLDEISISHTLRRVFNEPTPAFLYTRLYATMGKLLSPILDNDDDQRDWKHIARLQNALLKVIQSVLNPFLKGN